MLVSPWIAACVALFLWWFLTGAILMIVKRNEEANPWGPTLAFSPLLAGAALAVWRAAELETVPGVMVSFVATLLIWGWVELTFLTGAVTGPVVSRLPDGVPQWERFIRAWGTVAYHEMLLVAVLLLLFALSQAPGPDIAFWTFAILFFARVSAKLNLFLGVPRIHTEFLPRALAHLPSHFRFAKLNWLFPISVTALSLVTAHWLDRLSAANAHAEIIGFALLATLTGLALLEHWLMVLPLPDQKLWRWMLPASHAKSDKKTEGEAHGF